MQLWDIQPSGGNVTARNRVTGEIFSGTRDQLNAKMSSIHKDSFSRILNRTDLTRLLSSDSSSPVVYTIPTDNTFDDLKIGSTLRGCQAGTGTISFAAANGVTIRNTPPTLAQYQTLEITRTGANEWSYAVTAATTGGGGGGGATTFAALTDKATVDLPATNTPLANALAAKEDVAAPVNLSNNYTVTPADDGKIFNCTAPLTITVPAGLSPKPSFIPVPPPTGNLSLAFTGGAAGNGSAATQTFTRASNPTGVAVVAYEDGANGYGVGAGGGGGATTFAALTDKATVDLPAVNTPLAAALSAKANATVEATLSANRTITSADDGRIFPCTAALTITVPGGLTPRPGFILVPPPTGNLTLTPSGAATLNGAATPIVRTFASNRNGVLVTPNPHDVNDYSVSGV